MVPSSPNGPCSTGNTTSTPLSTSPARSGSSTSSPPRVGSPGRASAVRAASTDGSARSEITSSRGSSVPSTQPPSAVMPTGTTSNRSGSRCPSTDPAETHEIACSLLRPPNTTATRTLFPVMATEGRRDGTAPTHPSPASRPPRHAVFADRARRLRTRSANTPCPGGRLARWVWGSTAEALLQLLHLGEADHVGELVERRESRHRGGRRAVRTDGLQQRADPRRGGEQGADRVEHQREARVRRSGPARSAGCGRPRPS